MIIKDEFELEQLLEAGGAPDNLQRLLDYHKEHGGGSVNPREQHILDAYWKYQRERELNPESGAARHAFWALVNAQHALNTIHRWGPM